MIQRYFAGDLRPDQKKSWKAEDGIFILYTDYLADLAEKDKMITTFMAEMDHDQKDAEYLHEQIAALTARVKELESAMNLFGEDPSWCELLVGKCAEITKLDEQIAFMKTELIEKQKYILGLKKQSGRRDNYR